MHVGALSRHDGDGTLRPDRGDSKSVRVLHSVLLRSCFAEWPQSVVLLRDVDWCLIAFVTRYVRMNAARFARLIGALLRLRDLSGS